MSVERIDDDLRGGEIKGADEMNRARKDEEEEKYGGVVQRGIVVCHCRKTPGL